jgi:hypothetical protein
LNPKTLISPTYIAPQLAKQLLTPQKRRFALCLLFVEDATLVAKLRELTILKVIKKRKHMACKFEF